MSAWHSHRHFIWVLLLGSLLLGVTRPRALCADEAPTLKTYYVEAGEASKTLQALQKAFATEKVHRMDVASNRMILVYAPLSTQLKIGQWLEERNKPTNHNQPPRR